MKRLSKMKIFTTLLLVLVLFMPVLLLGGCDKNDDRQPWEISDSVKQNFANKINSANYVIDSNDGTEKFLRTNVCSKDLVWFDYYDNDSVYNDFAVMTVNDRETFQAFFNENGLRNLTFLQDEKALNLAAERTLLSFASGENVSMADMDELFQTYPEEPLKFSSREEPVLNLMRTVCGLGGFGAANVQEVFFEFDKEDPTEVVMSANANDVVYSATITFGNAESDERIDAWKQSNCQRSLRGRRSSRKFLPRHSEY